MEEASLENLSLSVRRGEVLLLCGASGSGKTSVIRLMNGLIPHYYKGVVSGDVIVEGRDISKTELYELAGVVGTVFQNPRSQFFSVETDGEIVFGPEKIGLAPEVIRERKEAVVDQMDLSSLLGRSLFALSGGEKQRIACASVATLLPEIILLDEPSSNLDWAAMENLRTIMESWKKQGKTIVISEHRLWYLSGLVDRVIYMDRGRIADEWTGRDFYALEEERIRALKLRPTTVPQHFAEIFGGIHEKTSSYWEINEQDLVLRDFYFSYQKKPYVFRSRL